MSSMWLVTSPQVYATVSSRDRALALRVDLPSPFSRIPFSLLGVPPFNPASSHWPWAFCIDRWCFHTAYKRFYNFTAKEVTGTMEGAGRWLVGRLMFRMICLGNSAATWCKPSASVTNQDSLPAPDTLTGQSYLDKSSTETFSQGQSRFYQIDS